MPERLEQQLRAEVNKNHPDWSEDRKNAYIYSTLRKTGWKPENQKSEQQKKIHPYFRKIGRSN